MATLAPSRILRTAFEPSSADEHHEARLRLRASYLHFKERAALLANEIHRDLPDFTVHDASHLDALWELADQVAGPTAFLNPLEAYVLGGAILLHDLGLALASYPGGKEALRQEPEWSDAIIAALGTQLGRTPTAQERLEPSEEVERDAEQRILRQRHAAQAEKLAEVSWQVDGETLYLIEDTELRAAYGPLIGRIAHSHWWPTNELARNFDQGLGPPGWCPSDWIITPLKLACWLRVCDALHLDARRAPLFLRALRQPASALSEQHWKFQEHLARPYLRNGRFEFTAGKPFDSKDAETWWVCHDTLALADKWIHEVQAVLADSDLEPLAIQGVSGVDDPQRLARLIHTRGWIPVDTEIEVSNVPDLVLKLGGEELYGDNAVQSAVRELIQNAADAVRARRVLQRLPEDWGEVIVAIYREGDESWLEILDTGIGMRQQTLTGHLLDFGQSFWGSGNVTREYPGLLSGGFQSIGRYGIGFYSIFMLGSIVQVQTRPYEAAIAETQVLEFRDGVNARPVLRPADAEELLEEGGTRVRVLLGPGVEPSIYGYRDEPEDDALLRFVRYLAPALDVSLFVQEDGCDPVSAVEANDWISMDGSALLDRLDQSPAKEPDDRAFLTAAAENLELLTDAGGATLGRGAIIPPYRYGFQPYGLAGTVAVGGLRSAELSGITGVLVGESTTAARDASVPLISEEALAGWASRQAVVAPKLTNDPEQLAEVASIVVACGGDTGPLPIGRTSAGWVTKSEAEEWARELETVVILQDAALNNEERDYGAVALEPHVIAVAMGYPGLLQSRRSRFRRSESWPMEPFTDPTNRYRGTMEGVVLQIMADTWGVTLEEIHQKNARFSTDENSISATIGKRQKKAVLLDHLDVIERSPTTHD